MARRFRRDVCFVRSKVKNVFTIDLSCSPILGHIIPDGLEIAIDVFLQIRNF